MGLRDGKRKGMGKGMEKASSCSEKRMFRQQLALA